MHLAGVGHFDSGIHAGLSRLWEWWLCLTDSMQPAKSFCSPMRAALKSPAHTGTEKPNPACHHTPILTFFRQTTVSSPHFLRHAAAASQNLPPSSRQVGLRLYHLSHLGGDYPSFSRQNSPDYFCLFAWSLPVCAMTVRLEAPACLPPFTHTHTGHVHWGTQHQQSSLSLRHFLFCL